MEQMIRFMPEELCQLSMWFSLVLAPRSLGTTGVNSREPVEGLGSSQEPWVHRKRVTK
jgi:hypothetical protein